MIELTCHISLITFNVYSTIQLSILPSDFTNVNTTFCEISYRIYSSLTRKVTHIYTGSMLYYLLGILYRTIYERIFAFYVYSSIDALATALAVEGFIPAHGIHLYWPYRWSRRFWLCVVCISESPT